MRVIVTGGRDYGDAARVWLEIVRIGMQDMHAIIVHGAAPGADTLARFIAEDLGLVTEAHPANWNKWGKAAVPIRNQDMVDLGADLVLAFPGGADAADCVRRARAAGIEVREVK